MFRKLTLAACGLVIVSVVVGAIVDTGHALPAQPYRSLDRLARDVENLKIKTAELQHQIDQLDRQNESTARWELRIEMTTRNRSPEL